MLITFDSNVSKLVSLVAHRVDAANVVGWCVSECVCNALPTNSQNSTTLAYDTPISLCRAPIDLPDRIDCHFVYLDFSAKNPSLERIRSNARKVKAPCVIIANAEQSGVDATYVLSTTNATDSLIANGIASIIDSFARTGKLQHPNDIASGKYGSTRLTRSMSVDVLGKYAICNYMRDCVNRAC